LPLLDVVAASVPFNFAGRRVTFGAVNGDRLRADELALSAGLPVKIFNPPTVHLADFPDRVAREFSAVGRGGVDVVD
jgi:hypothetical protein